MEIETQKKTIHNRLTPKKQTRFGVIFMEIKVAMCIFSIPIAFFCFWGHFLFKDRFF